MLGRGKEWVNFEMVGAARRSWATFYGAVLFLTIGWFFRGVGHFHCAKVFHTVAIWEIWA